MNIVGIIAEYNPFHNGHLYHLQQSQKITNSDYTIVVMSPNFVQRGAPAITDKWARTKMALLSGVDLVIELPTPYATASAEFFAKASISLLHHTGITDYVCFGSESNNIIAFEKIAHILNDEPPKFKELLKQNLSTGSTFPKARASALSQYFHNIEELHSLYKDFNAIISSPNNILGIEYIKALKKINSNIVPYTLQRTAANYHEDNINGSIASATAVRKHMQIYGIKSVVNSVPLESYDILTNCLNQQYVDFEDLSKFLAYRLLFSTKSELKNIVGITEGIENRIFDVFKTTQNITEMVSRIKSKRFTQTAIQRMLLNILLQITKDDFKEFEDKGGPLYIRVLGFRKSSQHLLTEIKKRSTLPLVMNVKQDYRKLTPVAQKMLDIEIRSTNIYSAMQRSTNHYNLDFTQPLVVI